MSENPLLAAALNYAQRGWHVFPCHSIREGRCSCKDGANCENPGKHPRISGGFHAATTDEGIIRHWWEKWRDANVGIATGKVSGLVILDIDPRNGGSVGKLPGNLPITPAVTTGGGGEHFYMAYPTDLEVDCKKGLLPGVDVKANGGYAIAPPSNHVSGEAYYWKIKP